MEATLKAIAYCYSVFFIGAVVSASIHCLSSQADLVFSVLTVAAGTLGVAGTRSKLRQYEQAGDGRITPLVCLWTVLGLTPILAGIVTLLTTGAVAVAIPVGVAVMCLAAFLTVS